MGRIIYVSPRATKPAGGIRTLYRHVEILTRNGLTAVICHMDEGVEARWFQSKATVINHRELISPRRLLLKPDDHIVFCENSGGPIQFFAQYRDATRHLFAQNQFEIFDTVMGLKCDSWQALGVTRAFACAPMIADAVQRFCGFESVPIVPCAGDPYVFHPSVKSLQIAYMPRKRPDDVAFIRRALGVSFPALAKIPWVQIDGQSEAETAGILGCSAIFLSLGRREGLGLPPLEAMACGCLVVGFTGIGGRDYATPANGIWCDEDDLVECVFALGRAATQMAAGDSAIAALIDQGKETAARYTLAKTEAALLAYWRKA